MSRSRTIAFTLCLLAGALVPRIARAQAADAARQQELVRLLEQLQSTGAANAGALAGRAPAAPNAPPGADRVLGSDPEALIQSLMLLQATGQAQGESALVRDALAAFARARDARERASQARRGVAGDDSDTSELARLAAQQEELRALLERILAGQGGSVR